MSTVEDGTIAMIAAAETTTMEEDVTIDVEDIKTATTHQQPAAPLHGSRLLQLHQRLMADMAAMVLLQRMEFHRRHPQWVLPLDWPLRQDLMLSSLNLLVLPDPHLRRRLLPMELHRPHQATSHHHQIGRAHV